MFYALIENSNIKQYPYTVTDLRRDNPNTSFPREPSNQSLAEWGMVSIIETPQPDYSPATHSISRGTPILIDAKWTEVWVVEDASTEEITQRAEDQANALRSDRNQCLSDCDWTQLADAPVDKVAWGNYRQALRDLTAQEGFPWTVTWPTKP